jgi:hypothetical protein
MVNGFLVRHDGSMISIDHIVWIELSPIATLSPTQYDIWIRTADYDIKWNKDPRQEPEAKALIGELRQLLRKAIEL